MQQEVTATMSQHRSGFDTSTPNSDDRFSCDEYFGSPELFDASSLINLVSSKRLERQSTSFSVGPNPNHEESALHQSTSKDRQRGSQAAKDPQVSNESGRSFSVNNELDIAEELELELSLDLEELLDVETKDLKAMGLAAGGKLSTYTFSPLLLSFL